MIGRDGESIARDFRPLPWLTNRHAQTLWAAVCRRHPRVLLSPERLELDDGDCLDIFWGPPRDGPVVLLLHGLGGCARSPYMLGLTETLTARGYQCVIMQYRGAGAPNRLQRFYYAGDTGDPAHVAAMLASRYPRRALYAVGVSLGANILINWLAEPGCPVQRAVAISPPFDLGACADAINRGFSRLYQRDLLGGLKRMYEAKFASASAPPIALETVRALPSLRAFDNRVTAPFHGFRSADHYYAHCSCGPRLASITAPCLILHARDDPFIPPTTIPSTAAISDHAVLATPRRGGHVGFIARGDNPISPTYWAEATAADFIDGSRASTDR